MGQLIFGQVCPECGSTIACKHSYAMPDQTIARDKAIEAVADPPWQAFALDAIGGLCEDGVPFTSDDVWHELDGAAIPRPPEPRAMGAAMRKATTMGLIEPTDRFRISSNTASPNHRRPQRIYEPRST